MLKGIKAAAARKKAEVRERINIFFAHIREHKKMGAVIFGVAFYWFGWWAMPTAWISLHTYRPLVVEVTQAQAVEQNTCRSPQPTDPCQYHVVMTRDGEYRNHDMASFIGRLLIKDDSSRVQNLLDQAVGKGPQVIWVTGLRWPLMSWFPHVLFSPKPLANVIYNPNFVWWGFSLIRTAFVLTMLGLTFYPLVAFLRWRKTTRHASPPPLKLRAQA